MVGGVLKEVAKKRRIAKDRRKKKKKRKNLSKRGKKAGDAQLKGKGQERAAPFKKKKRH